MKVGARAKVPPGLPAGSTAVPGPVRLSPKAELRRVAVRDYARLRAHARNCPDCVPGATDADPPRINRVCRFGMTGKVEYERAYRAWVDCPEEEGL